MTETGPEPQKPGDDQMDDALRSIAGMAGVPAHILGAPRDEEEEAAAGPVDPPLHLPSRRDLTDAERKALEGAATKLLKAVDHALLKKWDAVRLTIGRHPSTGVSVHRLTCVTGEEAVFPDPAARPGLATRLLGGAPNLAALTEALFALTKEQTHGTWRRAVISKGRRGAPVLRFDYDCPVAEAMDGILAHGRNTGWDDDKAKALTAERAERRIRERVEKKAGDWKGGVRFCIGPVTLDDWSRLMNGVKLEDPKGRAKKAKWVPLDPMDFLDSLEDFDRLRGSTLMARAVGMNCFWLTLDRAGGQAGGGFGRPR